ncbi:mitochondrial import receptor subunit TOM20 homolog [Ruditapes philippinarum]|uniref:mitochondrial import receptor subunit TOM20 homolog n=1 Tax=Ruditapes philippinarum TaxID=129788 RepID=UPI00295A5734|nr:mitochondrial import receptor subunit TOM20 homolog [Ruditapes philippinarum]
MLSKTSLGIAAAGAGICFLGYCIYFDKKRRSDPDFRQKLKEKRRKNANKPTSRGGSASTTKFPDPNNQEACQQYFMQEIQLGEMLLSNGQIEEGVDHLANAVVICGQGQHLMQVFSQTLPPEVVSLLTIRIPIVRQRLQDQFGVKVEKKTEGPKIQQIAEDDVE